MAVKDYRDKLQELVKNSGHIGYYYVHIIFLVFFYELFLLISSSPNVSTYNSSDIWFYYPQTYIPLGTLLISITVIIVHASGLYVEMSGIKTKAEKAKDISAKKEFDKFPYNKPLGRKHKTGDKKAFKPEWRYAVVAVGYGFVFAALIFIILRFIAFFLAMGIGGADFMPAQLDSSPFLRDYHTNIIQDIALALGAGFYDEMIFRKLLFENLSGWLRSYLKADYFVFDVGSYKASFMKMGKTTYSGMQQLVPAMIGAIIYALVHEIFGSDPMSLYTFTYRFLFGLVMTYIFIKHKFATTAWTHVWYDTFYFLLT